MKKVIVEVELMVESDNQQGQDYVVKQMANSMKKMKIGGCGVDIGSYNASVESAEQINSMKNMTTDQSKLEHIIRYSLPDGQVIKLNAEAYPDMVKLLKTILGIVYRPPIDMPATAKKDFELDGRSMAALGPEIKRVLEKAVDKHFVGMD